jgi:hypothetical protein
MKTAALIALVGYASLYLQGANAGSLTSKTNYLNQGSDWTSGQCSTVRIQVKYGIFSRIFENKLFIIFAAKSP